jgi:hypothetical protein
MLWTKMVGSVFGIVGVAAAAFLMISAQGCAQLPFGHQPDSDAVSSAGSTAALADAVAPGGRASSTAGAAADPSVSQSGATVEALAQTTTMPGSASEVSANSHKVVSPVVLTTPTAPVQGGAVVPVMAVAPVTTIPLGASGVVSAEMNKFVFHSPVERARYEKAAARFPNFCQDWQRMLHDRETNNLEHLTWQTRDGFQTSSYTGYGQVETCETKESVEGVPIGKLSYEEMIYYLSGKSADEARHAPPKLIHQTHTLEIFSWEKEKWFY